MKGKAIRTICIILILLLSLCQIIPVNVSAVGDPVVELRWDDGQDLQYADVSPGSSGQVAFTGTVSADLAAGGAIQDVRVNLRARSEQGWTTSITPTVVTMNPGTEEAPFTVTVTVPPETSCQQSSMIIVDGTAEATPGTSSCEVPPITGTILIEQYHKFNLDSSNAYIETKPDSDIEFELTIFNLGNDEDKFSVRVLNLDSIEKNDFKISIIPEEIGIPEKGSGVIKIKVEVPEMDFGVNEVIKFEVGVRSDLGYQYNPIEQTYEFRVRVKDEIIFFTTEFIISIILIIAVVVAIILIWKRKKAAAELYNVQ